MSNITNLAEHQEYTTDNVVQFPKNKVKKQELDPLEKECTKLKKDDTPKKTKNNSKRNRDNIQPFKEDDVPVLKQYLKDKIATSRDKEDELINQRNYDLIVMGLNIGLRCGDLVSLRWNDVYDGNWNFLEGKKITPQKTKNKNKHVLLKYNDAFKAAIEEYRKCVNPKYLDGYIFKSREGEHITVDRVGQIIKDAAKATGINYSVSTHSLRKTFARVRYDHSVQKDKTLVELMRLFNHASTVVTMAYIGITENELEDLYNDVNL